MHAMLKNRLLALFACGFATGVAARCETAPAQDQFITQPSSPLGNSPSGAAGPEPVSKPQRFITQRTTTASQPSAAELQVSALPSPRSPNITNSPGKPRSHSSGEGTPLRDSASVQWVPRSETSTERSAAKHSYTSIPASRPLEAQSTPSKLTSWPLLPAGNLREERTQLPIAPETASAASVAPQSITVANTTSLTAEKPATQRLAPETLALGTTLTKPSESQESQRRSQLAALVSKQILEGSDAAAHIPPGAVDNPEGWNSIGWRLAEHIRNCQRLLARRAYFSAREEAKMAIAHLMQTIDLHEGSYESEPNFVAAMTALREAQDFTDSGATHGRQTVSVIIGAHSSNILNHYDVSEVSPLAAAEYYRIAAADKLVAAAKNHPWASELYYTLGRVDHAEAESSSGTQQANLRWRAMTLYRAAAAINPRNAIALNQLGVIFLQMDRPRDASEALVEAVRLGTPPEAANNLIAACQKTGDTHLLAWARQNARRPAPAPQPSPRPNVMLVPGQTFASMNSGTAARRVPQTPARLPAQTVGYRR